MNNKTKIVVIGLGYVGLSNAILLSSKSNVIGLDLDKNKIKKLQKKISPLDDSYIQDYLKKDDLNLVFDVYKDDYLVDADFVVIATPTNYDPKTNYFDIRSVEISVLNSIKKSSNSVIVIKSTVPVGFTKKLNEKHNTNRIIFSPEFLREGFALKDNLYPSRIIVSNNHPNSDIFMKLLSDSALKKNVEKLIVSSSDAEAIKLFANAYLAMRVSFFNELDSYALSNKLSTKNIIDGVCLDPRVGRGYNNPSFGYGGYCLPKDTKQLLSNFENVPQSLIKAIVTSNSTRKDFIANYILEKKPKCVGIFRLIMKKDSDNVRESSLHKIIERITSKGVKVIIYEPLIIEEFILNSKIVSTINELKTNSDIILTNRHHKDLDDVKDKVLTRDCFRSDI